MMNKAREILKWCPVILIGGIILEIFTFIEMDRAYHRGHENSSIDFCQDLLQSALDIYVSDNRYTAVADTNEKMRAYKTIDDIIETELRFYNETEGLKDKEPYNHCLEKIFEGRKEYKKNPYERYCIEEEIVRGFEGYIEPKGEGQYIELNDFKGYKIWIWIQGSREEGFKVKVLPGKKDPFSDDR